MRTRRIIAGSGLVFTGLLFLYAGTAKSANPAALVFVLEEYRFNWTLDSIRLAAAVLPVAEIVLGLLILANLVYAKRWYRFLTLGAGVLLLLVFLAVLAWGLANRDILGCGCFGGLGGRLSIRDVLRDVLFILAALAGFLDLPGKPGTEG